MGAASCPGFFAVDGFQSILPSCCWEPGPLGRGKHSTYQNLGDRFPALWTRCQDRSKSHTARRYHERSLQGSRRKNTVLPEPRGAAAPPSLPCCQLQALCSGKAPQLLRVLSGWSRGDAPGPGDLRSLWGPWAAEHGYWDVFAPQQDPEQGCQCSVLVPWSWEDGCKFTDLCLRCLNMLLSATYRVLPKQSPLRDALQSACLQR